MTSIHFQVRTEAATLDYAVDLPAYAPGQFACDPVCYMSGLAYVPTSALPVALKTLGGSLELCSRGAGAIGPADSSQWPSAVGTQRWDLRLRAFPSARAVTLEVDRTRQLVRVVLSAPLLSAPPRG